MVFGRLQTGLRATGLASGAIALAAAVALVGMTPAAAAGLVGARAAARDIASGPAVTGVEAQRSANKARIAFDLNRKVAVDAYLLANPDRVVVDLPETAFLIDPGVGRPESGRRRKAEKSLVESFRFGQFAPGRSRIVLDLSGPARIVKAASEATAAGGAARLVIELASSDRDTFRTAARAARLAHAPGPRPDSQTAREVVPPSSAALPLVVVDAGHGGVDMGASSSNGAYEKDIVLDFARRLAARLESDGLVRTLLTRRDDEFIPLRERVAIARKGGAALFVSIHADTLNEESVHGATVYTVSDRASDAEAARVAASENAADKAGGMADSEEIVDVNDILADLTRRETRSMSHVFATSLIDFWKSAGDLNKNPIRSAGFVVLKAPDVPSVLLELGYLSNAHDLAKLTSTQWREEASGKVAQSIERYFARRAADAGAPMASIGRQAGLGAAATR